MGGLFKQGKKGGVIAKSGENTLSALIVEGK
jgi:hypothetical protein